MSQSPKLRLEASSMPPNACQNCRVRTSPQTSLRQTRTMATSGLDFHSPPSSNLRDGAERHQRIIPAEPAGDGHEQPLFSRLRWVRVYGDKGGLRAARLPLRFQSLQQSLVPQASGSRILHWISSDVNFKGKPLELPQLPQPSRHPLLAQFYTTMSWNHVLQKDEDLGKGLGPTEQPRRLTHHSSRTIPSFCRSRAPSLSHLVPQVAEWLKATQCKPLQV